MFKVVSIFVLLTIVYSYVNCSAIREDPRTAVLEQYEETNRNTILNERDSYRTRKNLNILAREAELSAGRDVIDRRRIRRDERVNNKSGRRPDSEYQAFLGPDFILPDNWRSLYSSAGLSQLSPCSSKK